MAILKMELINIIGPVNEFDSFVKDYIIDSPIHLENAISNLTSVKGLYPYVEENPYLDIMKRLDNIQQNIALPMDDKRIQKNSLSLDEMKDYVDCFEQRQREYMDKRKAIEQGILENQQFIKQLQPMENMDIDLRNLFNFEFVKFRFGRLPRESYKKLNVYLENIEAFFIPVLSEVDYVWGIYFTPAVFEEKIDSIFSSLYFERIRITEKVAGTPAQTIKALEREIAQLNQQLSKLEEEFHQFLEQEKEQFTKVYSEIKYLYHAFEVRRYAAHTQESFYIVGWIPQKYLNAFIAKIDHLKNISYIIEEPEMAKRSKPPTELRNLVVFKPFESLVKMYGLPSYNEVDPTMLLAITFVLMFGIMFGDVGQGALLVIGGWLFYKKKGMDLGKVISFAGISSMFFGWFFGSIFGFEDVIAPLWEHPMKDSDTISIVLVAAIGLGVLLLTVAMIMNMVNGIKEKKLSRVLFDPNGLAGFIFYWSIMASIIYFFLNGKLKLSTGFIMLCFVLPLLCMFMKEPLDHLLAKKKQWLPENKGMFFMETFFEMFEVLLSFFTNTISFVRVGAFALSHAGMMMVVFIFVEMIKGAGNIIVLILGNLLVIGLEGLIVGIQVLRLEFYELFGRFFRGDGRPFKPVSVNLNSVK